MNFVDPKIPRPTEFGLGERAGRVGQAVLVGYWTSGAFQSLAYFDEYWCIVFTFEAARGVVAGERSPANP